MNPTVWSLAVAAFWSAVGGVAVWLVTIPLRRRSLGGLLASLVLTGTIASLAAVVSGVRSMFLPMNSLTGTVAVALLAGVVASIMAAFSARRLARDNRVLRDAVIDVGAGRVPQREGRPLTAQLERVRTELANTAQRLAESRDRENALEASRRELVAWVSHDLRAPLAGIRAMAEALEDGVADPPDRYYKQIHSAVDRLSTMVDDLFELSRLQAGKLPLEIEPIELDDVVSDSLATLEPLANSHGVRLSGRSDGPAEVRGSVRELNRALTNLVANAIRHTPSGGAVEIRVAPVGEQVEVSVRDECGGIPAEEIGRIFDVGFRGEPARTPVDGAAGAGLGLAITRGIAEAHGGTVDVANVPGGCRFALRLPAA